MYFVTVDPLVCCNRKTYSHQEIPLVRFLWSGPQHSVYFLVERSNSFSLILVLNVLNALAFLRVFLTASFFRRVKSSRG